MKYRSISSVTSKSAMTPSFMGLMATMLPGVLPSISLASVPTASTLFVNLLMATMEGSSTTTPFPRAKTRVFAVPRSMAKSWEKDLKRERKIIGPLCSSGIQRDHALSQGESRFTLPHYRMPPVLAARNLSPETA